jgi:hypothetical protein
MIIIKNHFEVFILTSKKQGIVIYLTSSCVIWDFFGMSGPV